MAQRLPKKEFDYVYQRVPRLNVEIIVNTPKGVILTKRTIPPALGTWHIPGGSILLGEKISEAIDRIIKDELGIQVRIEKLLGLIEYPLDVWPDYPRHNIGLCYKCRIRSGEAQNTEQTKEFDYFTVIPDNTLVGQKEFLEEHLKEVL